MSNTIELSLSLTPEQFRALHAMVSGRIEDAEIGVEESPRDADMFAGDLELRDVLDVLDGMVASLACD